MQVVSPMIGQQQSPQKFFQQPRFQGSYQKTNNFFNAQPFRHNQHQHPHPGAAQGVEFDGKRLRKAVIRKTIDYNSAIVRQLELRVWQRDQRDFRAIQPDAAYYPDMIPPPYYVHNPINAVTTKFVRTSTNKMRCPIFCVAWTPEGRRLVTGASSGEFTLWNGLTFNFETILQAHDSPVRCMVWSHNDLWMVTGDHAGFVKYWQSNMNNVKMFQAHKEPLRGIRWATLDGLLFQLGDVNCPWIFPLVLCIFMLVITCSVARALSTDNFEFRKGLCARDSMNKGLAHDLFRQNKTKHTSSHLSLNLVSLQFHVAVR